MSAKKNNLKTIIIVGLLFLAALSLRLYGLNWDQSQHLHPDERYLTMVENDIKIPASLSQYLTTAASTLNPYNYPQYQFFVYGTFPLFLVKFISAIFHQDNYNQVFLWGRGLSAFFDSLNIILLFLVSKKIFKKRNIFIFLPSLLYIFCILPLQLSHFFAVDTFLNTFLMATFTALVYDMFPVAAIFFGLALASKVTALYFAPIIFLFLLRRKSFRFFIISGLWFLVSLLVFRFFQPYAFTDLFHLNPQFVASLKSLETYDTRQAWYPPGVQWLSKTPLVFSLFNLVFFGLGLPLSLLVLSSLPKIKKATTLIIISLTWIIFLLIFQGLQLVQTMRYFIELYPFICLIVGYFSQFLNSKLLKFLVVSHLLLGLLFLSIYSRSHSRVQASKWIVKNIPAGSSITNEYWDDPLPLENSNLYHQITLSLYDPDTSEKWQKINTSLGQTDYIIMSSNRLWGSIPLAPNRYPVASKFYQDLFAGRLPFSKLAEINSYPGLNLPFLHQCYYLGPTNFPGVDNKWFATDNQCAYPGIYLRDDTAEEAFTVYDHPKVLIFAKRSFSHDNH